MISTILGWNWYLLMHFSTGSKVSSETWFILYGFSFISKFETVLLKKVFSSSAIFWSFCSNPLFSTSFMLGPMFPFFQKMVSQSSKKAYYRLKKRDLRCWKSFLFLFNKGNCNSFFISYKTLRMICLLFKVNLFQVKPPHYGFP